MSLPRGARTQPMSSFRERQDALDYANPEDRKHRYSNDVREMTPRMLVDERVVGCSRCSDLCMRSSVVVGILKKPIPMASDKRRHAPP